MNILFVINNLITGGAERMLVDTLIHLDHKNLKIDVMLLSKKETFLKEQLAASKHVNLIELDHQSPYNPIGIWKLKQELEKGKYDLIHVHLIPSLYYVRIARILAKSHAKLIYTEHCPIVKKRRNFVFRSIDNWCYRGINRVVCVSEAVKESIERHLQKFNSEKLIVINNAINLSRYREAKSASRKSFNLQESDFLCLQVSSFRPAKDHKTLLKAFKETPEHFKLLLAGEGHLIEETRSYCAKLGLTDRVLFLNEQSNIESLYKMTDVVILSSHYEGFGLAALEAMSAGKPVVASRVGGLINLVAASEYLFETGDANRLRELLLRLESDADFYNASTAKGLEKAKYYDIKTRNESLLKVYAELVS